MRCNFRIPANPAGGLNVSLRPDQAFYLVEKDGDHFVCRNPMPCAAHPQACDCGRPALSFCAVDIPDFGLVVCGRPLCTPDGHWADCHAHRHRKGSMGTAEEGSHCRADFNGFVSNGTFIDGIKTFFLNRLPLERQFARLWSEAKANFPPPSPLYPYLLRLPNNREFKLEELAGKLLITETTPGRPTP